jgi:hypothetical protein
MKICCPTLVEGGAFTFVIPCLNFIPLLIFPLLIFPLLIFIPLLTLLIFPIQFNPLSPGRFSLGITPDSGFAHNL